MVSGGSRGSGCGAVGWGSDERRWRGLRVPLLEKNLGLGCWAHRNLLGSSIDHREAIAPILNADRLEEARYFLPELSARAVSFRP